jgi:hypothetical protein
MLHGLRSVSKYVGEQLFFKSWILYYLCLPFVGAILATGVYLVLRAGLITGGGSQDPFGFAAVGFLMGLFSAQAAGKLKQVFETMFTPQEQGSDALPGSPPTIESAPSSASVGASITIAGANFVPGDTIVMFSDLAGTNVTVAQDGTNLTVTVPTGATDGPVTVTTSAGTVTSASTIAIA